MTVRLAEDEARRRFAAARVARLATVDEAGQPHLVPVTFALSDPATVVLAVDHKPKASDRLRRLANIAANPRVSLLADEYADDNWTRLWWVRVDGSARVVERGRSLADQAVRADQPDRSDSADQPDQTDQTDLPDLADSVDLTDQADLADRAVRAERAEHERAVASLVNRYPQYAERPPTGPAIVVAVDRWSGWSYASDGTVPESGV